MTSAALASTPTATARRVTRAVAVLAAAAAAVVAWAIAGPGFGVDMTVTQRGTTTEVGVPQVALNAVVGALLGWVLLAVLERFTRRPRRIWVITALALLALSFATPFTAEMTAGARASLLSLHIVVAAVVIPVFARTSR